MEWALSIWTRPLATFSLLDLIGVAVLILIGLTLLVLALFGFAIAAAAIQGLFTNECAPSHKQRAEDIQRALGYRE